MTKVKSPTSLSSLTKLLFVICCVGRIMTGWKWKRLFGVKALIPNLFRELGLVWVGISLCVGCVWIQSLAGTCCVMVIFHETLGCQGNTGLPESCCGVNCEIAESLVSSLFNVKPTFQNLRWLKSVSLQENKRHFKVLYLFCYWLYFRVSPLY